LGWGNGGLSVCIELEEMGYEGGELEGFEAQVESNAQHSMRRWISRKSKVLWWMPGHRIQRVI